MRKLFFSLCCIGFYYCSYAQNITPEQYIETYKSIAIREMHRSGVPASITLAQGILEAQSGNSDLAKKSNNHFGIKCKSNWVGERVFHDDDEAQECFRKYNTVEESYIDHSNFLKNSPRYASLFNLKTTDYKGWSFGLKKAGYATNPQYPNILIRNIERYNLQQYDVMNDDLSVVEVVEKPKVDATPKMEVEQQKEVVLSKQAAAIEYNSKIKLNGLDAIYVSKGTSLLALATKEKLKLSKLMEWNDLTQDGILDKDQYLYLQEKPKQGNVSAYIAKSGESLFDVAQASGVQLKSIAEYNKLPLTAMLDAGTKIYLRQP